MTTTWTAIEAAKNSQTYLVLDYYKHFSCKGSNCRSTCCAGWGVTIPRHQYYQLLGMECPQELRDKIDRTFQPTLRPTPDRFAEIIHNYEGNCPLLTANGLCSLHAFGGETLLPSVCRFYPRGPKRDFANEASCANSCERTLELLLETTAPLRFETAELQFAMPLPEGGKTQDEKNLYARLRAACFDCLGNRAFPLATRILSVGKLLHECDRQIEGAVAIPDFNIPEIAVDYAKSIPVMMAITRWFFANNHSIAAYSLDHESFEADIDVLGAYRLGANHLSVVIPEVEIAFEKIIINHLFFRQFPFQEPTATFADEFASLVGTYAFLRYLAVVLMRAKTTVEAFIDLMAKAFRVIAHTRFEHNILVLLQNEGARDPLALAQLVYL